MRPFRSLSFLCAPLVAAAAAMAPAAETAPAASRESLRAAYNEIAPRLARSAFGQPVYVDAREDAQKLTGNAYAVLAHPFAEAARPLGEASQWCEILLLPFNVKHCEASDSAQGGKLTLYIGRKFSTPLEKTHRLDLRFEVAARSADYLQVLLTAPQGPFGTRDYRIVLELSPADSGRSFLHLGYSYGYGKIAHAAMQAYLSTVGAKKVGFTADGQDEQGHPALVRGMRGVMERNTMRYYLAIEAYLKSMRAPAAERPAKMIDAWFAAVERYPRQLHELERGEYVAMKRAEFQRMREGVSPARRTASSSP